MITWNFAERFSFTNCAEGPRILNSITNFLIFTIALLVAYRTKTSATELKILIQARELISKQDKKNTETFFKALFVTQLLVMLSYIIYCLAAPLVPAAQIIFVLVATIVLAVVVGAFAISMS